MDEKVEHTHTCACVRYVHSDKIKDRRRSLFPCEKNLEIVDISSDNSDIDHMSLLSSSDNECGQNDEDDNIKHISSTKLIYDMLSTPKSKKCSEQSMSPLYLSPYGNTQIQKSILSSVSPTKNLKTPNDSFVHSGKLPKLSRKCLQESNSPNSNPQPPSFYPTHPKFSKVRTSLFPELDVSLAPKRFYPKIVSESNSDKSFTSKQMKHKRDKNKKKAFNKSRKLSGQINAGVRHNIKKPKDRKSIVEPKLSEAAIAKIKTFKKDTAVTKELGNFLKNLQEWNESKQIKLIQPPPSNNVLNNSEHALVSNLKRCQHDSDDTTIKKPRLDSDESCVESSSEDSELNAISTEDLPDENSENINEILNLLDDSIRGDKENRVVETKQSKSGEYSFTDTLLSPTSEMCNMTSVMKIESPKKVKNLNLVFEDMSDKAAVETSSQSKLYPVFYENHRTRARLDKNEDKTVKGFSCNKRKRTRISADQMLLDAGQKRFGLTECAECDYVYHAGDPNDEILHENHHNATHILQFAGWKNEHVVAKFPNGSRIIEVLPGDSKIWIEKVKRVIEVINRDMGYYDITLDISASKVFLHIMNKTITGCLVAERKTRGFKVLSSDAGIDLCSKEEYLIECGVSRIWVLPRFRKQGIATKLMDTLKSHFIPGCPLNNCDIALSSPTTEGKLFAAKYLQTPNFFTYFD